MRRYGSTQVLRIRMYEYYVGMGRTSLIREAAQGIPAHQACIVVAQVLRAPISQLGA